MKKTALSILLILSFYSCAEIIYNNEAKVNFDRYTTGFVFYLESESAAFPLQGYENKALNHFTDKLEDISGFSEIYSENTSPLMADSVDLKIILTITNFSTDKYFDSDDDKDYYKSNIKVSCLGQNANGEKVFEFTRKGEVKHELEDNFSYYDNDREALTEALDKIAIYFLKSFRI